MKWNLYGKEIDFSSFMHDHPGGDLALILGAERDCTKLFEQYHPNAWKSRAMLKSLTGIGIIPSRGHAFHEDLLKAAQKLPSTKATWTHTFQCIFLFFLTLSAWISWFRGEWESLVFLPAIHWLLAVNVSHDAAHFAFSSFPFVNEILALLSAPLFFNTSHWYMQHNISHHEETNEAGKDLDLSHFQPFARLHPKSKWKKTFTYQILTIFFGFFGSTIAETLIFPFFARFKSRQLGNVLEIEKRTRLSSWIQIFLSLAVIIVPHLQFSYWKASLFSLVPYFLSSIIFMAVTQISHVQEKAQKEKIPQLHWSRNQVQSSMDYSQHSRLTIFLTGGLNCQGLHHCLPFLNSSRFYEFYPTYRQICNEHGVEIIESKGFLDSLQLYFKHIYHLSFK